MSAGPFARNGFLSSSPHRQAGPALRRAPTGISRNALPVLPPAGHFVVDDLLTIIRQHERAGFLGRRSASLCQTYGARGNAAPFSLPNVGAAAA
jgi:hypothetical protein